MAAVKKPEMAEKKGAAIRRIIRYERQMEGLEETAALQDIQETKGVSRLGEKCLKAPSHSNKNS